MKLDNTTRKLQVLLDATVSTTACDVIVCYRDENRNAPQAIGAVPSATYLSTVSSATVVDMLPAPLVNTVVRVPERISLKNRDTTTRTPTFRFNDNATTYQFWSPQLLTGESAFYDEGQGWYAVDANGNRKQVTGSLFSSLTVTGLVDISATGAGQIKFPATQNASADANTLDDYEEGTWTPTDASGAGLSFSAATGTYTKIGRIVFYGLAVTYPVTVDGSNSKIGSLPFTLAAGNENRQGFLSVTNEATLAEMPPDAASTTISPSTNIVGAITNATLSTNLIFAGGQYHV